MKNTGSYKIRKKRKDNIAAYCFLFPAILSFVLFVGIPIILAAVLSFFDYNLVNAPKFIGLSNIRKMVGDKGLQKAFANTVKFLLILCV